MLEYYDPLPVVHPKTPMDMVQEFATKTKQKPDPTLYGRLIEEEYKEWHQEALDKAAELKELADLVYVIYGYANAHGYDLDEAVRRVHENNLGRCIQPDGSIKRREDGKIIKNPNFPKVYLGDLI
jgi:predicted HAD superfamily Cof-like phosphohydrolase